MTRETPTWTLSRTPMPTTTDVNSTSSEPEPGSALRQRVLFCGLHCRPGQLDLFPTDGPPRPSDDEKGDA